jgi:hypothetical protein
MFVDAQSRGLAIGKKANAVETCVPHALDNLTGIVGDHAPPIASKFDGRRKQCRGLLERWGKNCDWQKSASGNRSAWAASA